MTSNPSLYKALCDDFSPPATEWSPTVHPQVGYVLLMEGEELLGLAICNAHTLGMWEVHNLMLPTVGWKKRVKVATEFFQWLRSCGCWRVIGKALAYNRYAIRFNETIGMERIGVNQKAFMRDGVLQDEVWFGLSLPMEGK